MAAESADVIVIGGGPAGSTAATMLARKGFAVTILERERFPREHIGESLLPASMPVLQALGVLDAVAEAGFLKKWGATMIWGKDTEPWSWYFRETNATFPHAYQVWRPTFDHLLLKNAAANGVEVCEEHRVTEVQFEGDRLTAIRYTDAGGVTHTASPSFVVDASGQAGIIGRARRLRQADASFQNLAIYGYYEGADRLPPPDETNILVESYEHGWFWNIPLHSGLMSVGAVVDHRVGQEGIREHGPAAFLANQIAETKGTAGMLRAAKLVSGPVVLRDWSYLSDAVAGENWALAGDAACFIDPLFSSGVHLALTAGVMAAAYATSAMRQPEIRAAAGEVFQQLYYQQYGHFREMAKLFYSSNLSTDSYFWEARRILGGGEDGLTPRQSFIRAVAGQPPQGYERVVLERGHAPAAFVAEIRAAEGERARRQKEAADLARNPAAFARMRSILAPDSRVERRPVLGDGEFAWGTVMVNAARPEGVQVSGAAARLISLLDGRSNAEAVATLVQGMGQEQASRLAQASLGVLQLLYVEGVIERFEANDGD